MDDSVSNTCVYLAFGESSALNILGNFCDICNKN